MGGQVEIRPKGVTVQGVGPGTTIGGRYTIQRRLAQLRGAERWSAHDETLDRAVAVLCFPTPLPAAPAAVDAARRASALDNTRLVRIVDVGSWGGVSYVVEEGHPDAETLGLLVTTGGLPAEEVRRICGEAASALESASQRGLHHLRLSPLSVMRLRDGSVVLSGLATESALSGTDDISGSDAARQDAVGIVGLVYAGLTGRWPLPGDAGGLARVPAVVGGVPAPSEIAAGVPSDLDAICRLTLNEKAGPLTPGDFAAQVAPWSPTQVGGFTGRRLTVDAPHSEPPAVVPPLPTPPTAPPPPPSRAPEPAEAREPAAAARTEPVPPSVSPRWDTDEGETGDGGRVGSPPPWSPAAARGTESDSPVTTPVPSPRAGDSLPPSFRGDPAGDTPWRENGTSTYPVGTAPMPVHRGDATTPGHGDHLAETGAAGLAAAGGAGSASDETAAARLATAGALAGQVAVQIGGRVTGLAKAASERASERVAERVAERRAYRVAEREVDREGRVSLSQAPFESGYESPAPLLPQDAGAPPSQDQSRTVLILFAGFVIVALMFGLWGLSQIGKGSNLGQIFGTDTGIPATGPVSPSPTGSSGASGSTSTGSSTAEASDNKGPVAIIGVTGYDPYGDGHEHDSEAARVYDEDPNTYWSSEGYFSPLSDSKPGVGLVVDMGQTVAPTSVNLQLPTASDVELYLNGDPTKDGATKIGSSTGQSGSVTIQVTNKAKGQYLIVWFTKVSQGTDGRYRATLAEITINQ